MEAVITDIDELKRRVDEFGRKRLIGIIGMKYSTYSSKINQFTYFTEKEIETILEVLDKETLI